MSTSKLVNFPHFLDSRSWGKNMSTPKLIYNFPHFLDSRSWGKTCIYIYNMYICTYVYYTILLYLEGSGSKFHSVNAKTSQSCPFFGVQELGIEHVNTKTNQFSPFFGFQELRKNVNTKTSQFSQFFGFQELRTNMSTPKLVNFHQFSTFFEFQELSKNMCIYIYVYVHLYITWFCYIWRVVVPNFSPSAPKLVNFPNFLDSRSWEKTCQHQN